MPTNETLERFIARVEQNAHVEAVEEFYTADSTMRENLWIFRFEWTDGTVTRMEELAYQRWEGERIAEEQFFCDPAQRIPVKPAG